MKKLVTIFIAILVIGLMGFTAFASGIESDDAIDDNGGSSTIGDVGSTPDVSEDGDYDVLLDDYRQLLDISRDNIALRHELMRKIVALKNVNGDDSISVFVRGKEVQFDVPPVIQSNRTLIPVRAVTTALGAHVDWDPSEPNIVKIVKTVADTAGNETQKVIVIDLDTEEATINNAAAEMDVPPILIGDRTMVPIRFIAEAFNMKIDWDPYVGGIVVD